MAAKKDPGGVFLSTSAAGIILLFISQVACGVVLGGRYVPSVGGAHSSVQALRSDPLMRFLADFHYFGSAILLAASGLHLAMMLWLGWYRKPHQLRWAASIAFFLGSFGLQVTGNLLPMARFDVQTAVIEASLAARIPFVGDSVRAAMLQGSRLDDPTLKLWYDVHRFAIPVLVGVMAVAALFVHFRGKGPRENRVAMLIPVAAAAGIAAGLRAPFGAAPNAQDFESYGATVGWYTWPLHGVLKALDGINLSLGWLGIAVLPALFVGFLCLLPLLQPKVWVARVGFLAFAGTFLGCAVQFGGTPAPFVGDQDPPPPVAVAAPKVASPIEARLAARGRELFASEGCEGCHGVNGSNGSAGPDLSRIYEEHPDAAWYTKFIRSPRSVDPGSTMPAFESLDDAKLRALAEFLRSPRN